MGTWCLRKAAGRSEKDAGPGPIPPCEEWTVGVGVASGVRYGFPCSALCSLGFGAASNKKKAPQEMGD